MIVGIIIVYGEIQVVPPHPGRIWTGFCDTGGVVTLDPSTWSVCKIR